MFDHRPEDEESPVLLRYRHGYNRKLTWVVVAFVLSLNVLNVWMFLIRPYLRGVQEEFDWLSLIATVIAMAVVVILPWWFEKRFIISLTCFNDGMDIKTARGRWFTIAWREVRVFRRARLGLKILEAGERKFYLFLPEQVLVRLIALLKETSDAQIRGFGDQ